MGTSVGVISLDLVIKENLQKQLDKIKSTIQSGFQKPMETVSKAVDKTLDGLEKSVDNFKTATKTSMEKLSADAVKPMEEMQKKANESLSKVNSAASKPITTKINVKTVTAKELLDAQGIEDPINKINEKIAETGEEIKEKLGKFEIQTDPVKRLEQELENTREKADLLQKKWQELNTELGKAQSEADASKIISQINATEKQLISLQSHLEKLQNKIENPKADKLTQTIESYNAKIKGIHDKYAAQIKAINEKNASKISAINERNAEKIKAIQQECAEKIKAVQEKDAAKSKSIINSIGNNIKKTLGGAFNSLKSVGGKALDGIKGKFSKLHGSVGSLEKPVNKLGRSIKNAFRRVFVMAGILTLVKAFRSAITNACNGNDEFAKSLNAIKANLNIAFEPIKNTVMPYINALMQGLAKVTQAVAAFINSLFGTTYQKSLSTLKKAQKANKETAKEAKTYLASFDEMNVAQDTSSSDKSDDGVDYSDINGDNVKLPDWAERMKEAIRSGDWKGVGSLLAEKLNSAVDGINWGKIQSKVNGFMSGLADGLNGFIETINWGKLGNAFGNGINTIFGGMYTFIKKFNWSKLGKGIADFLNGAIKKADWALIGRTLASRWTALIDTLYAFVTNFDFSGFGISIGEAVNAWFDEIDWAKLGETISESIKGLFDTIMGFLETVDWQGIGEKLWTLVKSIDWGGIVSKLFKTIGELIGASVSLLWGFIKEAVFKIRDYFKEKIQDCGGNIVKGLFKGIGDALKSLYTWIKEHIFKPFIDGFKKVFGIHSPSKVLAELGEFLIDGLLGAIKKGIELVKSVFKAMVSVIKSILTPIADFFKNLFSGIFSSIKNVLGGIIQFIKGVFTGNWSSAWDGVKKIFKGVWDGLVTVVKAPINLIISAVNAMLGAVESGINWVIDGINKLSFDIPDWVPIVGGETFGFNIPTINIPEIPKLAVGGLATAPTLAMVGDNRNAKADPEVIAPLSKLQGMLTDGAGVSEIIALLREIVDILKSLDFTFEGKINERTLWKAIVKLYREHKIRTGGATI